MDPWFINREYTKLAVCVKGHTSEKLKCRSAHVGSIEKSAHSINCTGQIEWENMKTIKVDHNRFDRKVREALEIQHEECGPSEGGINLDDGQYVTTKTFCIPFF